MSINQYRSLYTCYTISPNLGTILNEQHIDIYSKAGIDRSNGLVTTWSKCDNFNTITVDGCFQIDLSTTCSICPADNINALIRKTHSEECWLYKVSVILLLLFLLHVNVLILCWIIFDHIWVEYINIELTVYLEWQTFTKPSPIHVICDKQVCTIYTIKLLMAR